jgi:hypothetical protein
MLEYVSPMIVTKPLADMRDVNGLVCKKWMPLYKNLETWTSFGLSWYIHKLKRKKSLLTDIMAWLYIRPEEKYQFIYMDMLQVAHVILGEEKVRCFSKNS